MATNQTTNYELNQWLATDQVVRTDFNADNAKLDVALAAKADSTDVTDLSNTVNALSVRADTLETALTQCGNCKIVSGTYVGTGTYGKDAPCTLNFDYKPLLVSIMPASTNSMEVAIGFHAVYGSNYLYTEAGDFNSDVNLTWKAKALSWWGSDSGAQYNASNQKYCYVALLQMD